MCAKGSLLTTLRILDDCLNDPALVDKAPNDTAHNARARMLRQGLAVLMFSTMESFIRQRTGEILQSFSNPGLNFSDLPRPLQKATTMGALEGIRFRLKFQPPQDKINWLVGALTSIVSVSTDISKLSVHSFGHATSNLIEEDVNETLKAFGVSQPWKQLTGLSHRLGVAIPDSHSEFASIKERRHASAHALTANVLHADLANSARSTLAICIGFDLLLSHARDRINTGHSPGQDGNPCVTHENVELIFVTPRPGTTKFMLRKEQRPPPMPTLNRLTIRIMPDLTSALIFGKNYAKKRHAQIVVLDATSTPTNWDTCST